jgi:hypothetical protein
VDYLLASGTLQQSTITYKSVPVFDEGRGNLGRSPVFSETDLTVYHDFRLTDTMRVNLNLNVLNLFDQDTVTGLFAGRYRDQIAGITDAQFFQGFDAAAIAAARNLRPDARFGLANAYQGPRTVRIQAKLLF